MKNIKNIVVALFIGLLLVSCNEEQTVEKELNQGQLVLQLGSNQRTSQDVNNYGLKVENAAGEVVLSYEKISDAPEKINLAIGDYTVKVASADEMPYFTFDAPYYYGDKQCTINSGEETVVDIVCALKHVKLTVNFDGQITETAKSYEAVIQSAHGEITIDASTANIVYAERSALVISTTIEKEDGSVVKNKQIVSGLETQSEYTLNISY
ncbi:DUF4493 domain-containing protein [Flammeovirga aprica]|uniref:DUF4493 domain-containing protein n=1 Tax=Flammeovirga aprica JL-4 TaxID=694437 RepID=A0A7X9XC26_9BACT|nr:DUF4493 domain-containing protein [Flammeovirga aprica]NME71204.1 DUF4493 domain-containing protein [Flammeovirga aprica JL-4]